MGNPGAGSQPLLERRRILQTALVTGLGLVLPQRAGTQEIEPRNARPREGDQFVFAAGDREGAIVAPIDIVAGAPPVAAYPLDPHTGMVRDGSRLNQMLFVRLDPGELSETMRPHAADGIVAYSAVCTHAGCNEWVWQDETKRLKCPCHDSEFDLKDGARVLAGPAPRRLATLPLKIVGGALLAAGGFTGRVGFSQE